MKGGSRARVDIMVNKILIILNEKFSFYNIRNRLEIIFNRLEPFFDVKKKKSRKRRGKKKGPILIPFVCSKSRRVFLGMRFFVKAIKFRYKKGKLSLIDNILREFYCILNKNVCAAFYFKKQHLRSVVYNKHNLRFRKKFQ